MNSKERHWTFVLYPESAPDDWRDYLQSLGLQVAISPLHDKDLNPTGEPKKAHYHVLLCFPGPTTYNKVLDITKFLNSTIPQRVLSCEGIIRYFSHKDNPEKYQYDEQEITTINGLDISKFNNLTNNQILHIKREIIKYINDKNISSYFSLINYYAYDSSMTDYFKVISSSPFFFISYINSKKEFLSYEDRSSSKHRH